ncbi:pollen receptor-like kinase 4 [Silene latifolia]|uniref:pollen receptor-like kinase 4 n=1 Tax=Silene latifolia TaxID=37657 RepID=UPI003D77E7CD
MGAHAFGSLVRPPPSSTRTLVIVILSLLALSYGGTQASGLTETESLLKFKSSLSHNEAIPNWDPSKPPCTGNSSNWLGVICHHGKVWGLQLENMHLGGKIDIDALSQLPELRTISLKNNNFEGPIPDFRRIIKLRSIYLSNNDFSGDIPDDAFAGMDALRRVILSNNALTGKIPSSLAALPILVEAKLESNQFHGSIPNFQQKPLPAINMANNQLDGPLPPNLKNLNPKFVSGNKGLCGPPLEPCSGDKGGAGTEGSKNKSSSNSIIIALAVLLALVTLMLIVLFLLVCRKKQKGGLSKQESLASQDANQLEETYVPPSEEPKTTSKRSTEPGKLNFVRDDRKVFDLSALLTASAEVLESGNFVSAYKVEIFSKELLVVKRFRQMNKIGREDFHEHIRRMGRLKHPNVLALVAYYYRKEEKLLVFDFVDNGTLASHLHGNRTNKDQGLDWATRLKIIQGVARGLAYLYSELPMLVVPYGYLKSSNVLLDDSYKPLLMDYALLPLINQEQAQNLMVAYKCPEYAKHGRITKKTDVWSLGILILEVLTGRFPTNFLAVGNVKGENLVAWVNDIASDEEKGEDVFDKEMGSPQGGNDEMRKLLKIGFNCCHEDVDVRWSIKDAVEKIEEIQEKS